MILESMKMEFEVKSTKDGVIEKILVEGWYAGRCRHSASFI